MSLEFKGIRREHNGEYVGAVRFTHRGDIPFDDKAEAIKMARMKCVEKIIDELSFDDEVTFSFEYSPLPICLLPEGINPFQRADGQYVLDGKIVTREVAEEELSSRFFQVDCFFKIRKKSVAVAARKFLMEWGD